MDERRMEVIRRFGFYQPALPGLPDLCGLAVPVRVDGELYLIIGRRTKLVPADMPCIELLDSSSDTQINLPAPDAAEKFALAAQELVKSGRKFTTPLRRCWFGPKLVWTRLEDFQKSLAN